MAFAELKVSDLEEIPPTSQPSYQTRPTTSGSQQGSLLGVPGSSYGRNLSSFGSSYGNTDKGENKGGTIGRGVASAWSRSTSSLY